MRSHGGYLGQMCIFIVDILGICAFSLWISWAYMHSHGGYLGQMCIFMVDILGKCASCGYLGYMCIIMPISCLILKKEDVERLVVFVWVKCMGVPGGTPVDSYL